MSTRCSAICNAIRVGVNTVGTSTNCSTILGRRHSTRRCETWSVEILGTAMTCWTTGRSRARKNSSTVSTICGTGSSRRGTRGTASTTCCTVRRCTRACGPRGTPRQGGREPWGGRRSQNTAVKYNSCLLPAPGPTLSPWGGVVIIRGQEHLQRELLMPPVRPQPALAASPRCTLSVCNSGHVLPQGFGQRPSRHTHEAVSKRSFETLQRLKEMAWVVVVVVVLTVCITKMSVHERQRSSTELWEPCPCGHGSRPCTCVQGPKKSPPQPNQSPTSATVGARLTSPRRHLWISHDRHNRDNEHLVMYCSWEAGPWESASASRQGCR